MTYIKKQYVSVLLLLVLSGCAGLNTNPEVHKQSFFLPGGHTKPVVGIAWSKSGDNFASGSFDTYVKVWDSRTNTVINDLDLHRSPVYDLCFSDSENLLASADKSGQIVIWNWKDNRVQHIIKAHKSYVNTVVFIQDDKYLVSCGKDKTNAIKVWDVESGALVTTLSGHPGQIASISYAAGKDRLVSGDVAGNIFIWDMTAFDAVEKFGIKESINDIQFSPDEKTIAACTWKGNIFILSFSPEVKLANIIKGHNGPAGAVSFNKESDLLASISWDDYLKVWNLKEQKIAAKVKIPESERLMNVKFDPHDSEKVLVALWPKVFSEKTGPEANIEEVLAKIDPQKPKTGALQLWNIQEPRLLNAFAPETSPQLAIAVSKNNQWMAVSSQQTGLSLWKITGANGNEMVYHDRIEENKEVSSISFQPYNDKFAYTTYDGFINIYGLKEKKIIDRYSLLQYLEGSSGMTSIAYSPDGKRLAAMGGKKLFLFDAADMKLIEMKKLSAKTEKHKSIQFHPDSCFFAYLNHGKIYFKTSKRCKDNVKWRILDKTISIENADIQAFDISPDGNFITVIDSKHHVRVFTYLDSKIGTEIISWKFPQNESTPSKGKVVQYSNEGNLVAVGDALGNIALFHLMKLKPFLELKASDRFIYDLHFSTDDQLLYSTGGDSRIRVWDVSEKKRVRAVIVTRDGKVIDN